MAYTSPKQASAGYRERVILLRRLLGDVLRQRRQTQGRTLREVSAEARVSLGYLSEVERGQKEASSELLAAICDALGVRMSDLMREVSASLATAELAASTNVRSLESVSAPVASDRPEVVAAA
jgi:transcriptional regulator with XRE-family HTH domain